MVRVVGGFTRMNFVLTGSIFVGTVDVDDVRDDFLDFDLRKAIPTMVDKLIGEMVIWYLDVSHFAVSNRTVHDRGNGLGVDAIKISVGITVVFLADVTVIATLVPIFVSVYDIYGRRSTCIVFSEMDSEEIQMVLTKTIFIFASWYGFVGRMGSGLVEPLTY